MSSYIDRDDSRRDWRGRADDRDDGDHRDNRDRRDTRDNYRENRGGHYGGRDDRGGRYGGRDDGNDADREYRNLQRYDMKMKVRVWGRSPSPIERGTKNKAVVKSKPKEDDKKKTEDKYGRSVEHSKTRDDKRPGKSKSSSKRTSRRPPSPSSSESSSSSSDSSSDSSDSSSESSASSDSSTSSDERRKRRSKNKNKSESNSKSKSKSNKKKPRLTAEKETATVEVKDSTMPPPVGLPTAALNVYDLDEMKRFKNEVQGTKLKPGAFGIEGEEEEDDDDEMGPAPMVKPKEYNEDNAANMSYGGALMPGEGEAIAQFVQQNMRIPRRGEIGWDGTEIDQLENQGYVMSGSRHKRMNAIRLRKENQVYSAEEKRALAMITFEERQQKDNKIVGDFREMLQQKLAEPLPEDGSAAGDKDKDKVEA